MSTNTGRPIDCTDDDCRTAHIKFVELMHVHRPYTVEETLGCWIFSGTEDLPFGHNIVMAKGSLPRSAQYKIKYKNGRGETKYFKPKLHRMWFGGDNFEITFPQGEHCYDVSHCCHNGNCINAAHLVIEHRNVNLDRNLCQGPGFCQHNPQCLVPGSLANQRHAVVANYNCARGVVVNRQVY